MVQGQDTKNFGKLMGPVKFVGREIECARKFGSLVECHDFVTGSNQGDSRSAQSAVKVVETVSGSECQSRKWKFQVRK